jgi:hypothetical protein
MLRLFRDTNDKHYLKLAKQFAAKIKRWSSAGVFRTNYCLESVADLTWAPELTSPDVRIGFA